MRAAIPCVCAAMLALPSPAWPQAWPAKPIRMIVTVAPAGGADLAIRLVAPRMSEALGQPIVMENVAALGGAMGAERLTKLAPDGYNLMFTTPSSVVSIFFLRKKVPYRLADFTPISAAVEPVTTLVVHAGTGTGTFRDLLDQAKRSPGKLTYGTPGIGSVFHLMGEALAHDAGVQLLHVPYKSVVAANNDVMTGQIDMAFTALANIRSQVASGKLKVLAVLERARHAGLPDVPTVGELLPSYEKPPSWFALFGPAGLPGPITQRLQVEMAKSLNAPDTRAKLEVAGLTVIGNSPEEFAALIRRGFEVYGAVVKAAKIQPED